MSAAETPGGLPAGLFMSLDDMIKASSDNKGRQGKISSARHERKNVRNFPQQHQQDGAHRGRGGRIGGRFGQGRGGGRGDGRDFQSRNIVPADQVQHQQRVQIQRPVARGLGVNTNVGPKIVKRIQRSTPQVIPQQQFRAGQQQQQYPSQSFPVQAQRQAQPNIVAQRRTVAPAPPRPVSLFAHSFLTVFLELPSLCVFQGVLTQLLLTL